jgi:hypothetical protein
MPHGAFHLECGPAIDHSNASENDIKRVVALDDERGEHIVLTRDDGSFLHAAGEGEGPYMLVFHDEAAGRHYQAQAELARDQVTEALLDFRRGRTKWWDENDWTEVKHSMPWSLWAGIACLLGAVLCGVLAFLFW